MSDSFLDTVTRLIGCELLLGSSVFPLSVFHWMVWQYKSSPGALQLVGFPVPQLLMEAPEQEDPGFSHPPASPSFSFAVESFYSYSILVVPGGKFASPCIGWTMVGALPLCRRFDLCFSVKRSRLKSLMAARFIGNQSLCGWSCVPAAVAL